MSETNLKNCPFCGYEAQVIKNWAGYRVSCSKPSKCCVPCTVHRYEKDAIRLWNTRKVT